jgi:hypothetical protein
VRPYEPTFSDLYEAYATEKRISPNKKRDEERPTEFTYSVKRAPLPVWMRDRSLLPKRPPCRIG